MFTHSRRYLLLILLFVFLLAACGTPTPEPTPTTAPTEPPTSTPVPPTATSVPTNTPVPPTNTPQPTATPRPTEALVPPTATSAPTKTPKPVPTREVTPQSTSTKTVGVPMPAGVSSKLSTVEKSIQQALIAAQALNGQLDGLLRGHADLCPPMLHTFNSLIAAPTYDVNGQPANVQQAHALYRGAIEQLNTLGATLRTCGQNGSGTVEKNQLVGIISSAGYAANQLAQAWDLVRYEVDASSTASQDGPLLSAIRQVMYNSDVLGEFRRRPSKYSTATPQWWPFPVDVKVFPCEDYRVTYDRIMNAPTFDVSTQSSNAQAAYDKYLKSISTMLEAARPIYELCGRQEGQVESNVILNLRGAASTAHELLSQALQLLSK